MTWTLRVYDSDGVEIGNVTTEPYNATMTHPDSGWRKVEFCLYGHESGDEMFSETSQNEEITTISDGAVEHMDTPKEHLEFAESSVKHIPGVASTTVLDE